MGILSRSSSSSATNTTNNVDSSTKNANQEGAGVAVLGSGNRINVTDGGAIDGTFNFAGSAITQAFDVTKQGFELSRALAGDSVNSVLGAIDKNNDQTQKSNQLAMKYVFDSAQPASAQSAETNKTMLYMAIALVIGLAVMRRAK